MDKYYVDSCIWLNLFKKETKGNKKYWEYAQKLLGKALFSEGLVFYSGFVLKELKHVLNNERVYKEKLLFLKNECVFIKAIEEDYLKARKLESIHK